MDQDEVAADDKGSASLVYEKDGTTVTVAVRGPHTTHDAKISIPVDSWWAMVECGNGTWFTQQRQLWIAEMVGIYGFINRGHMMKKFGISMPQASADLARFQERNPTAIFYNATTKRYEPQ